jgi:hypothetical protein
MNPKLKVGDLVRVLHDTGGYGHLTGGQLGLVECIREDSVGDITVDVRFFVSPHDQIAEPYPFYFWTTDAQPKSERDQLEKVDDTN